MVDIRVEADLGALPAALAAHKNLLLPAQRAAIDAAGPYMERQLKRATPEGATRLLMQSTMYEPGTSFGEPVGYVGPTGAPSLYAEFVEHGRRPGRMPPEAPIAYWVRRKLQLYGPEAERATYLIRRKIGREGTAATHYIEQTVEIYGDRARLLMRRAAADNLRAVGAVA